MTKITKEHVEWAVIHRLRLMAEVQNPEFEVTQAFSILNAVVCWVIQRIRNNGEMQNDRLAAKVLTSLNCERISEKPWNLDATKNNIKPKETAKKFFINLRNFMTHGDTRNIQPLNKGDELIGFKFFNKNIEYKLYAEDMKRLAVGLADRYCNALQGNNSINRVDFEKAARMFREGSA